MFQTAHNTVKQLIADFKAHEAHYRSPKYQEAEVRADFIDKLFTALGWDVAHDHQKNPYEQEVKVEKAQRQAQEKAQKRADYAFSLAPDYKTVQFFVEAKKPSLTLRQNRDGYFQTAKYGWNAQTGVSLLTDFEEIVIIDCRAKPDFDTILQNELRYFKYTDLQDEDTFAEFYWLFSREAVAAGNLARYIADLPKAKGSGKQLRLLGGRYLSIDDSFLSYIDDIRLHLAQAFYQNNPALNSYQLTEATQRTIDRLVFMRFLEDKQIEPETLLYNIASAAHPWAKFITECKRLDTKYNGIVFKPHFIDQNSFLGADETAFRDIASDLDHTNTPYDFNYIPVHILGSIYERFLGNIIAIDNGKAAIEQKPEVRKAGGVFYTPKYIVDYIVENTVGKIIAGKNPDYIAKLKFADIACGSGSFLIGVYDCLLDYHTRYYNQYPKQAPKAGCHFDEASGTWVLGIKQKQRILLNNIYGVDIDLQATEVTQLSLFLKLLEDETMASANDMQVLFADKILPNLSGNICCGNSLIGYEIMDIMGDELAQDEDIRRKINPFDFQAAFASVFAAGGFDAIVGNPPYVKEYTDKSAFTHVKQGHLAHYYQGKMDLWYFFACYALDLLKEKGLLGYIVPNNWVSNAGASILRNKIINDSKIRTLIDFNDFMVFQAASIQTMIMLLERNRQTDGYTFDNYLLQQQEKHTAEILAHDFSGSLKTSETSFSEAKTSEAKTDETNSDEAKTIFRHDSPKIVRKEWQDKFLKFGDSETERVLNTIKQNAAFFLRANEMTNGIHPHYDFVSKRIQKEHPHTIIGEGIFALSEQEKSSLNLTAAEQTLVKPYFDSEQIQRYYTSPHHIQWLIYTDSSFKDPVSMNAYPNLKRHLDRFAAVITSDNKPYGLHRARKEHFFQGEKIICQRKCVDRPVFSYADFDTYVSATYYVIQTQRINLKYLLGLLNSNLVAFWLRHKGKMQGNNFQVDKEPLLQIPLIKTDNQTLHNEIVKLVEQLLAAQPKARAALSDSDKNFQANYIANLEQRINRAVYKIYGLNEDEIALIGQAV